MPQYFFINGRQYTREELVAKQKAGILSEKTPLKTNKPSKPQDQGLLGVVTKESVVLDIRLLLAEKGIKETTSMSKFLNSKISTLDELKAFLSDETNFFAGSDEKMKTEDTEDAGEIENNPK